MESQRSSENLFMDINQNQVTKNVAGFSGWDNCPADVLLMIFAQLDTRSLLICMDVNQWWREIFEYVAQHNGLWEALAQEYMWSRGVTFRSKSAPTAGWRDLFYNSRLWRHVADADLKLNYLDAVDDTQCLHVYKDFVIVVHGENLRKIFYDIGNSQNFVNAYSVAPEDPAIKSCDETNCHYSKVDQPRRMLTKLSQQDSIKRLIVSDDNCYYTLDRQNILRCSKFDESTDSWTDHTLARYYGCNKSISDIHIYNDEIFLLLKSGKIMRLDRQGRNFEASMRADLHWDLVMRYARFIETDARFMKTYIDNVFSVKVPDYNTDCIILFHEYSAVISVPCDREFKVTYDKVTNNMVLEYPGLSCATQHGDILFLGFKNGKIEIVIPNNVIINGGKPEVSMNIQDFPDYVDSDPKIVALDVHEANQSHYLFIALRSHIYKLIISYPDEIKNKVVLES